jgi:hypothetical protein
MFINRVNQRCTGVPKIWDPTQNSKRQNEEVKEVSK